MKTLIFSLMIATSIHSASADSLIRGDLLPLQTSGVIMSPAELRSCEIQASLYANGKTVTTIEPQCLKGYLFQANPNAVRQTEDGSLFAYAYDNMIVLQISPPHKNARLEVIAGGNTKLTNLRAVAIDSKNHEIAVLEGDNTIYIFNAQGGNVPPLRSFSSKSLAGATSLAIDNVNNELWVTNDNGSLVAFSRLADVDGRAPVNATAPLRTLSSDATSIPAHSVIALNPENNELFALDKDGHQILTLDLSALRKENPQTKAMPKRSIAMVSESDTPQAISYSKNGDRIEVIKTKSTGGWSSSAFPRTSNGQTPPLFSN